MILPEILHSPRPLIYEDIDSSNFDHHHQVVEPYSLTMVDHVDDYDAYGIIMDDHVDDYEFNTQLSTSESSTISEVNSIFTNDHIQFFPIDESETLELPSLMELDAFDSILCSQIIDIRDHGYQEESEGSFPSQTLNYQMSFL
jgi:hypothetical protein